MWKSQAISKGGGKDGKPAFGFPGFPPPVISTALLLGVGRLIKPAPLLTGYKESNMVSGSDTKALKVRLEHHGHRSLPSIHTVGMVPPSMTNSVPVIDDARSAQSHRFVA
jgi:hypothetical protein